MGAYLSQPKTDKVSTDEFNELLTVGASSMQGWRNSQEDAHNSILNFDTDTSFFAVYDGHGGAEVATYCADNLPTFLKELTAYKNGELEKALKEAFLGFDKTLLEPHVVEILKVLAGEKNLVDGEDSDAHDDDEDFEDLAELHEESHLPLDEVLEKYKGGPSMPVLKRVKELTGGQKPQSPYLRGRRAAAVIADATNKAVLDPDYRPEGSSTSSAAAAAATAAGSSSFGAGPSSSRIVEAGPCSSHSAGITKMDSDEPEEDSTVSSSSSSASKPNNTILGDGNESGKPEIEPEKVIATSNGPTTTSSASGAVNAVTTTGLLHAKENDQNGSVSSSEAKSIKKVSSTADMDTTVSGSNDSKKRIQNGTIGSTSSVAAVGPHKSPGAISSTSKEANQLKKLNILAEEDSTDDDADYDAENSSTEDNEPQQQLVYSSEEEDVEGDENSSVYSTDEEFEAEEDDVESTLANEQFCANMIEEPGQDSGCTAVVALLRGRDLYVANAGDSRCVVSRNGKAIEMSLDHKPEDDEESARILKAGGRVTLDGRVNGGLNLSRAIGDHAYKMNAELPAEEQMISSLPDIRKLIITPDDEFMVLACDGIWNYMSSDEVVQFVRSRLKESKKMSQICEELFDNCLAPNTIGDGTGCDNMTAVIVRFEPKLLEKSTSINPDEVVIIKENNEKDADGDNCNEAQKEQQNLKRCASPPSEENSNEAKKSKRLKTDEETSSTTNTTTSTIAATTTSNSGDAASSSTSEAAAAVASIIDQKDCDSNTMASVSDDADSDAAAVSST